MKVFHLYFGIVFILFSTFVQGQSESIVCKNHPEEKLPVLEVLRRNGEISLVIRDKQMLQSVGAQLGDNPAQLRTFFTLSSIDEYCLSDSALDADTIFECAFHRYGYFYLSGPSSAEALQGGLAGDPYPAHGLSHPSRLTVKKIDGGKTLRVSLAIVSRLPPTRGLRGVYLERKFLISECSIFPQPNL